jgi:RNA polymerase sigma-70 factor (ECF subfamily)
MSMLGARTSERFLRQRGRLFGYACAVCGEGDLAADLVQDCAVRVLTARKVPVDETAFRAWLFKIVRNLWLDRLRRVRGKWEVPFDDDVEDAVVPIPVETMIVDRLAVRQAFAKLSDHHRDVLALVDVGGFSYQETAILLDVSKGTIMSRVSRGRSALGRLLKQDNVIALDNRRERGRR